ncbi:hypothetical protein HWA94_gp58 [Pseudomonas phage ZC08]|uniref:Uncharacterized protein n=1 Tax=Pseudomonas phage ZC08 TaxID=1622116 RepID=A0A1L2C9C0_9CAUD|nr:hypothetical protein HWA94_gp58 [Pseudomonas phage ZC08]AMD43497.1 hypothetical protein ZC08_068 [Pseudomonas phage ZC08]
MITRYERFVRALQKFLDILVPRFLTEDMACKKVGKHDNIICLMPICSLADVQPGEVFDAIVRVQMFNLFGFGLFPKPIGKPRPFVNPYDVK